MKVIFNNSLLPSLSELGNTIEITNYIIGTAYSGISSIDRLFDGQYISRDPGKTGSYPIEAVWEASGNLLRANIVIPEAEADKLIRTDTYKFIYCYLRELGDTEKIGFILVSSDSIIPESGSANFTDLGLGLGRNLVDIYFPDTVKANIKVGCPEDIAFLEGPGISPGINIFKATPESNSLVSRDSYLQYLRNIETSLYNLTDDVYLNTLGEKVEDCSVFRKYEEIKIWTENSKIIAGETIETDNTLSTEGGMTQLLGEYSYTEYHVVSGKIVWTGPKITRSITNLYEFELIQNNTGGLKITLDRATKRIKYPLNTDPNNNPSCTIQVVANSFNPDTLEIEKSESSILKLSQGIASGTWVIERSGVKYTEPADDGSLRNLYLLGSSKNSTQTFGIRTNINVTTAEILVEPENPELLNFFDIKVTGKETSGSVYKLTVEIITKQDNLSLTDFNPVISGKSETIPVTLTLIPEGGDITTAKREIFYCIQGTKSKTLKLYQRISNSIVPVTSLRSGRNTVIPDLFVAGDLDEVPESGIIPDSNRWFVDIIDAVNYASPGKGIMNNPDPGTWTNPDSFRLSFGDLESTTQDLRLVDLVISSGTPRTSIYEGEWREDMKRGKVVIPVTLNGEPPHLQIIMPDNIIFPGLGVKQFRVRSNARFTAYLQAEDTNSEWGKGTKYLSMYDESRPNDIIKSISYSTFNDNEGVGVPVYYKLHTTEPEWMDNEWSRNIAGNIRIVLDDFPNISAAVGSKVDLSDDNYYFTGDNSRPVWVEYSEYRNYSIITRCNMSLYARFRNNLGMIGLTIKPIFENYQYKHHETTFKAWGNSVIDPSSGRTGKLGEVCVGFEYPSGATEKQYKVYQLPNRPYLKIEPGSSITLSYKPNEKQPFSLLTAYKDPNWGWSWPGTSADKKFNYSIGSPKLTSAGYYEYIFTVWPLEQNISGGTINLGKFYVDSKILLRNFLPTTTDTFLSYLTQKDVDELMGTTSSYIDFYQDYDRSGIEPTIDGSQGDVRASGEERRYSIIAEGPVSAEIIGRYNVVAELNSNNQVNTIFPSRLQGYSPFKLSDSNKTYLDYSVDLVNIGFDIRIRYGISWSSSVDRSMRVTQLGYKYGIVYRSESIGNTLFLSGSSLNVITEKVEASATSIKFMAGLYSISSALSDSSTGTLVDINSPDTDKDKYVVKKPSTSPSLSGGGEWEIEFPKNQSPTAITRTFVLTVLDNNLERHTVRVLVTQGESKFKVYWEGSDGLPDFIRFHSSGKCTAIQNNIGAATLDLETNIPRDYLGVLCPDSGSNGFSYTLTPLGTGTKGEEYTKYSLLLELGPNTSREIRYSTFGIYYMPGPSQEGILVGGQCSIRQGFVNVNLTASQDNKTYWPGQIVGTVQNPYTTPATTSGGGAVYLDRVLYLVNLEQQEVGLSGLPDYKLDTKAEFSGVNPTPEEVTRKVGLVNVLVNGKDALWQTESGGSVTEYFSKKDTEYNIEHSSLDQSILPFLENTYTTHKGSSESRSVILRISVDLEHIFGNYTYLDSRSEEVSGESEKFRYIITQEKLGKDTSIPDISILEPSKTVPAEGGDVVFSLNLVPDVNFEIIETDLPEWIKAIPRAVGTKKFGYKVDPNNTGKTRTYSKISVKTSDYGIIEDGIIQINQPSGIEFDTESTLSMSSSANYTNLIIKVKGVTEISCTTPDTWISFKSGVTSGKVDNIPPDGDAKIVVSVPDNPGTTDRSGTIKLVAQPGNMERTVTVTQSKKSGK